MRNNANMGKSNGSNENVVEPYDFGKTVIGQAIEKILDFPACSVTDHPKLIDANLSDNYLNEINDFWTR